MLAEMKANLQRIKSSQWDANSESYWESVSAKSLVSALKDDFSITFQERRVGRKHEIGLAKEVVYELRFRKVPQSLFSMGYVIPVFRDCFLISSYDDVLSELTWTRRIRVKRRRPTDKTLQLVFGPGVKIDKSVDGWRKQTLCSHGSPLAEDVLRKHGWQFDVFQPFGLRGSVTTP